LKSCTTLLHATGNGPGSGSGATSKESPLTAGLAVTTASAAMKASERRLYSARDLIMVEVGSTEQ
jgi:hypothetical protein